MLTTSLERAGFLRRVLCVSLLVIACSFWANAASAQSLIRDAEIEATLKRIAEPVFKSAGIGSNSIEVLVINNSSLNAFVVDNSAIFIHSGLILRLKSVEMLQSVIAHELAHITSGHLVRRALNIQNACVFI